MSAVVNMGSLCSVKSIIEAKWVSIPSGNIIFN